MIVSRSNIMLKEDMVYKMHLTSSAQLKIGLRKIFVEHKVWFNAISFAVN